MVMDISTSVQKTRKETVRKVPAELKAGDRIIFSAGMGGENDVVTVTSVTEDFATSYIHVDEYDFAILVSPHNTVKFA
jgi:preprotein translocase subunit YajC